jgi:hypothetical protein
VGNQVTFQEEESHGVRNAAITTLINDCHATKFFHSLVYLAAKNQNRCVAYIEAIADENPKLARIWQHSTIAGVGICPEPEDAR